ncbi:S24 family peptidase [Oceanithermus profundus]|uniref:S24 family peptidase n=1 Tax=Oceanithermus profundus TaxID=187137 RepID=UPI0005A18223|nr:S24/S26 family peptidase [Oceanithermus profundus]
MEYAVPIREDMMRPEAIAFEVQGDSMDDGTPNTIRDGNVVIVATLLTDLVRGEVFLVELPGQGLMAKRLRRVSDAPWFLSDKPTNDFFPAGDVVWVVGQTYGKLSYSRVS